MIASRMVIAKQSMPIISKLFKSKMFDTSLHLLLHNRTIATSSSSFAHSITEVNVPTPWGHMATKCWNLQSTENPFDFSSSTHLPVLCLHGWQDNAGTYDRLIPLLDKDIPFICLEFAGHGKSSPRPDGTCYIDPIHALDVKRAIDHFGLNETGLIIMGHSVGGCISLSIAGMFPEVVRKCLTLDATNVASSNMDFAPHFAAGAIKKYLENEKSTSPTPKYPREECLQRFLKGRGYQMKEESAKTLLERGLELVGESEDGGESLYKFARDVRVTFPPMVPYGDDQATAFSRQVSCPLMMFIYKDTPWELILPSKHDNLHERAMNVRKKALEIYANNCRSFELIEVGGLHHAHLDHPEVLAEKINEFLKSRDYI